MTLRKTLLWLTAFSVIFCTVSNYSKPADCAMATKTDIYKNYQNSGNKIALTFDDGPHPRQTHEILDILDEYGIKATFFVIGVNVKNYPEAFQETIRRGHEIGNHTYSHPHLSGADYNTLKNEIDKCESAISLAADYKPKLFRPPEGWIDSDVKTLSAQYDYKVILWNIDTKDWAHTPSDKIVKYVTDNVKPGDIILMHDYIGKNSPTAEALRGFIPVLLERGYQFVVVSELIGSD